jgi:hypothetical protein
MTKASKGFLGLFGGKKSPKQGSPPVRAGDDFWGESSQSSDAGAVAAAPSNVIATFDLQMDELEGHNIVAPPSITQTPGAGSLVLTGGDPAARSGGRTGGYSIRVPDSFEASVSEQRVRVVVVARAAGQAEAPFAIAYSTAEVGNSRWRKFTASAAFAEFAFEWDVPRMVNGNGDYLGILPDPSGALEVSRIRLEAIPRA